MSATQAHALPGDGTVVAGQADIQTSGSHNMLITQSSDRVIINWNNFSIAGNESVQFLQPGQNALAVNRVTGGDPSQIFGALTANGQLMLINPNGILFGQTSRVDVHSLVATTLDTADEHLLSNDFRFDIVKNPSATVVNRGVITAADGGLVALVAPGVANDGLIQARLGKVALASAHEFSVDLYGDGLVSLPVNSRAVDEIYDAEGNALSAPVSNSGTIRAPGGQVLLAARTAKNMVDDVVNMSGVIEARSVGVRNGVIVLDGGSGGGAGNGAGSGKVRVSGRMDVSGRATGEKAGAVKVSGEHIVIESSAVIDAAGDAGGGTVLVGGDYQGTGGMPRATSTILETGSYIDASAISHGDGGKVIAWADDQTVFAGTILARGGYLNGHGGLIETSGYSRLSVLASARADASALNGLSGQWLLDPRDVYLRMGSGDDVSAGGVYDPSMDDAAVDINTILSALAGGTSVTITTHNIGGGQTGNIVFEDSINAAASGGATLTLLADNNILLGSHSITSSGALNIVMDAAGYIQQTGGILDSASGAISLRAQDMMLDGAIDAGTGIVTLQGLSSGSIALGAGAGDLSLSTAEIAAIKAGILKIGDASAGAITIGADITPDAAILHLQTGAGITGAAGGVFVNQLALQAGGAVSLTANNTNVDVLAISAAGQAVDFTNAGGFSIGSVNGVSGLTGADVTLDAGGTVTQTQALAANNLHITATGDVTLNHAANNVNGLGISATGQNVFFTDASNIDLAGVTASSLALNAGGTVTDSADTLVTTLSVTALGAVTLDSAGNDVSNVTISAGAHAVAYTDVNGFDVAGLSGGNITLVAGGALTQSGAISGNILNVTSTGNIALVDVFNNVSGLSVSAAGQDVSFADVGGLNLAGITANSFTLSTDGAVTDSADIVAITLSVTAAGAVTLDSAGNNASSVSINAGSHAITYRDASGFDIAGLAGGNVTLTAGGALTQTGAISGNILNVAATGAVTLANAGNNVSGLNISAAGQNVSFTDVGGLDLAGVTANSFALSTDGAVTDSGNIVVTTLNVTADGNVTLNGTGNHAGRIQINAGVHDVVYSDNGAFDIAGLIGNQMTLNAVGGATQSGAISGNVLNLTATGAVTLTNAANNLNGLRVSAAGQNVSYTDANGIDLAGVTAGSLILQTGGTATDSAATIVNTLAVQADGFIILDHISNNAGVIAMDAGANNIVYTDANGFDIGAVGALTGLTGAIVYLQLGGNLTDSAASNISGSLNIQAGTNNITFDHAGNVFGALSVLSGLNLSVTNMDSLILATHSLTGTLNAQVNDGIIITGNINALAGATFNSDMDGNGTGDFTVNGGVAVYSGNNAMSVTANDIVLNGTMSSGSGQTTLLVSDGGAIDLGAGGSGDFNLTLAELGAVSAGILKIGDASAGAITISSDIAPGPSVLHLHTGSGITGTTGGIVTGALALQAAGAITLNSGTTNVQRLAVAAAGQNVTFSEVNGFDIDTVAGIAGITAGAVNITTGGALADTAATIANSLTINAGGSVTLDVATNDVVVLQIDAVSSDIAYVDANGFDIAGITGNNFFLRGAGTITDSGAITATGLGVQNSADVTLDHAASNVGVLAANTGAFNFSFTDVDGFDIATVGTVSGIQGNVITLVAGGAVTDSHATVATTLDLTATGAVTLDHAANNLTTLRIFAAGQNVAYNDLNAIDLLDVTAQRFTLSAGGAVTDTGRILVGDLGIQAAGAVTLNTANNNVNNLAINAGANNVTFIDEDGVAIDTVGSYSGLTGGVITLTAGGAVSGSTAISGTGLALTAGGHVTLNNVANSLANLAIAAAGYNVLYRDANALNIGDVGSISGIQAASLDLHVAGALADTGAAALNISGHTNIVSTAGTINLNAATNDFNTLSVSHVGNITAITDANSLTITGLTRTGGTGTASISAASGMIVSGNISTGALTLNADSNNDGAGTFTLNASNSINSLSNANITISSADIVLDGTINSGTGITAVQATGGNTIDLGNGGGGAYNISQAELNNISANAIRVGGAASGAMTVSSNISAANSNTLRLQGAGIAATAGAIIEDNLALYSTGAVTMTNVANDVTTLAISAAGQTVSFYDVNDLDIGSVDSTTGAAAGTLRLETAGNLTASQALTGTSLAVVSAGSITLDHGSNNFTNVAFYAPGQAVRYHDLNAVTINTVSGVTGIEAGSLHLTTTNGNVTDSARSLVSGATTLSSGTGSIILDLTTNDFNTLAITSAGAVTIYDANSLTLNNITASGATALESNNGLVVDGNATVDNTLSLNADRNNDNVGTLTVNTGATISTAAVNQAITLMGADLDIQGTGAVNSGTATTLLRTASTTRGVDIGGAGATYNISQAEINAITAGMLHIQSGTASGTLTLSTNITPTGMNTLYLQAGTGGIQAAGGSIFVANLALRTTGAGNINATHAGNDVDNLAIQLDTGTADFRDADNVNIDTVAGITGLNTTMTAGAGRTVYIQAAGITDSSPSTVQNFGFTSTAAVVLDHASNNFAIVAGHAAGQDVTITDANALVIGQVTTLAPSTLTGITAHNVVLNTGGALTDTEQSAISGNLTVNAGVNAVTLDHALNDFNTVIIGAAGNTRIADANNLNIGASSVTGTLDAEAYGGITVTNNVTSSGDATFRADLDNNGTGTFGVNASRTVNSSGAHIIITAADLDLIGNLNSGTGNTTITVSPGLSIGIGDTPADMSINKNELQHITARNLYIGSNLAGNITVDNIALVDLANVSDSLYIQALGNGSDIRFINNASFFKNVYGEADDSIFVDKNLTATVGQISLRADMDGAPDPDGDQIYVTDGISISSVGSSLFESTNGITIGQNINIFGDLIINADTDNDGVGTLNLLNGYSIATNNYNLSLIAADFILSGLINAGTGRIQIETTNGRSIGVGDAVGDLHLSKPELQRLSAGSLYVGGLNTSNILVDNLSAFDVAGISGNITLASLTAGSGVSFNNAASSFGNGLTLLANNGVTLNQNVNANGLITIDADYDDNGVGDLNIAATRTLSSNNNDISITANDVTLPGMINSGTARTILLASDNATIDLGGAGGGFNLTVSELNNITSDVLSMGAASGGPITISSDIAPANSQTMLLYSGGAITATAGGIIVNNLGLSAGGAITITDTDTNIGTIAATTTNGHISVYDADLLRVGTVGGMTGLSAASGNILLRMSDLDILNAINSGSGTLTLEGRNGNTIGLGGAGGDMNLTAAELALINANTLHIGTAGAGAMAVSADAALSGVNRLELQSGSGVTATAGGLVVSNLDIAASGDVVFTDTSTDVTTLSIHAAGHNITFFDANSLSAALTANSVNITANNDLTITASLAANGTVNLNADADNNGSGIFTLNTGLNISTTNNALTITANDVVLQTGSTLSAGTNAVRFNVTNGGQINLGGAGSQMSLSNAELAAITAGTLTFGNVTTSAITLHSLLTHNAATINLNAGGTITGTAGGLAVNTLNIAAGGAVNLSHAANDVDDLYISAAGQTANFRDADGINLAGITAAIFSLNAGGAVTDNAATIVNSLSATATGTVTLDHAGNDVNVLNISAGSNAVTYTDVNGFDIAGLAGGAVTLNADGALTDSGTITATTLSITATSDVTLNTATNDVDNLTVLAAGRAVSFTDADGVNLAGITASSLALNAGGVVTDSAATVVNSLSVTASGAVTLDHAGNDVNVLNIAAGSNAVTYTDASGFDIAGLAGGIVTLNAGGALTDSGTITATTLSITTPGDVTLNTATNDVDNLAVSAAGRAVTFTDVDGVNLTGIAAASLSLNAGGAVTDSLASVISGAAQILAGAGNDITLDHAGNDFSTLSIASARNVTLLDSNNITLGNISAVSLNATSMDGVLINGAIATSGAVNMNADGNNNGNGLFQIGGGSSINATNANIVITASDADIVGTISSGLGATSILSSNGRTISLGGVGGDMVITNAELNAITASTVRIGDATAGNITVVTDIAPTNISTLHLRTGGSITGTAGGIGVTNLALNAGTGIDVSDTSTTVSVLAARTATGNINFINNDALSIATVDSLVGIQAMSGNVSLQAQDYNITQAINNAGGITTLRGNIGATISLGGVGGAVVLSNAELNAITAATLRIGDALAGHIIVVSDVTPANVATLHLRTSGSMVGTAGGIGVASLAITAGTGIALTDTSTALSNLAATTSAGNVDVVNNGTLNISTVEGVSGIQATGGNVTLRSTDLNILQAINNAGGITTLLGASGGTISLGGAGGALSLTAADLDRVTAATLRIGDNAAGNITIVGDIAPANVSTIHLLTNGMITGTAGGIAINNLALTANGDINITDAQNNVTTLAVSAPSRTVTFHDADALVIGTVGGVTGAAAMTLNLTTVGGLTDNAAFIADSLNVVAGGAVVLDMATNDVNNLSVSAAGHQITFVDVDDINISGVTANGLTLTAGGAVTDSGAIVVQDLNVTTTGDVTLNTATNDVDNLAVSAAGRAVAFTDTDGINLSGITAASLNLNAGGAVTDSAATVVNSLSATATSAVTLDHAGNNTNILNIAAGSNAVTYTDVSGFDIAGLVGGTVTLNAAGALTDSDTITANTLSITTTGDITLNTATNDVDNLSVSATGRAVAFTDADGINLVGITAASLTLSAGSAVTDGGAILVQDLNITSTGDITLNEAGNDVDNLTASAAGRAVTFTDADGINLAGVTASSLTLNAVGTVTDSAATVVNSLSVAATSPVTLDYAGNNTNILNIAAGANAVTYTDVSGFDIAGLTGDTVTLNAAGALTGSGTITANTLSLTTTGDVTLNTATNDVDNLTVSAAGRAVTFTDVDGINLAGITASSLALNAGGAVTDSLETIVNSLSVTASGAVTLDHAGNDVNVLNVAAGSNVVAYTDVSGFDIAGLVGGAITLNAGGALTDSGTITANTLSITTTGDVTLNTATNDIDNLTVSTAGRTVSFTDTDGINLAGVTAASLSLNTGGAVTDSLETVVNNLSVAATGAVTLDHAGNDVNVLNIAAGSNAVTYTDVGGFDIAGLAGGIVTLNAGGALTDSGTITATTLSITTTGDVTLNTATNDVDNLTVSAAGRAVTFTDADGVNLAGITAVNLSLNAGGAVTDSLATNVNSLSVTATGPVTLDHAGNDVNVLNISAGSNAVAYTDVNGFDIAGLAGGAVTLNAGGALTDSGAIIANSLSITTTGDVTLNTATNDVDNLSVSAAGRAVAFTDTDGINLAGITADSFSLNANGAVTDSLATIVNSLSVTASGAVTLDHAANDVNVLSIAAGSNAITYTDVSGFDIAGLAGGNVALNAGGALTDSGLITANSLSITTTGDVTLNTATNDVDHLMVLAAGRAVTFMDADGVNLAGITAASLTLTTGGAVTDSAASVISGATQISAGTGNDVTLDHAGNDFSIISVLSGRNINLNDMNALALGASTISGTLDVTAASGVTLSGAVTTAGATNIQADSDNDGVGTFAVNGGQSLNTGNSALSVTAGDLALSGGINSGSAATTLNVSNNGSIGLGAAGDMQISAAEATNITAANLHLGHAATNAITIGSAMNFANVDTLQLRSAGTIGGVSGGIQVNNLVINAGGPVNMGALSNNVNVLAISAPGQSVSYNDINDFTVGTVNGIAGISGSTVALSSGGAISAVTAINAPDLSITSAGAVNLSSVAHNVNNLAMNAAGQDISFRTVGGLNLTGMNVQNGTIITNGALTDSGALIITGALSLTTGAANNITLDHAGNNFAAINVVSGRDVRIVDNGNLSLGASAISGALNIETQNNLTIAGAVQVSGPVDLLATPANNGIFMINGGASLNAPGQNITITAYDAALNGALNAGNGTVTMRSNAGTVWALGTAAGQFALSGAELAQITAATFTMGDANAGNILVQNVSGTQTAGIGNMVLQAHGNQSTIQFGPGAVSFRSLVAQADAEIRVMGNLSTTEGNMLLDGDYDDFYDMGYANNVVYGAGVSLFAQGQMNVGGTMGDGVMLGNLFMATNGGNMLLDRLDGGHDLTLSTNGIGNVTITGAIGGNVPAHNALINGNVVDGEIHAQTLAIDANAAYMTGTVGGYTDEDAAFYVVLHKKLPGPYFMNGFIVEGYVPPVPVVEVPVNTGGASDPTSMQAPWIAEVPHGLEQRNNTAGDLVHQDLMRHLYILNILEKADIFLNFSREFFSSLFTGGVKNIGEITVASDSVPGREDDDQ